MSESETPDKRELRIVFDGVIAVGPPPDRDEVKTGPFFGVMARSTRRLSDRSRRLKENPPKYIPVHVPTVYTTMVPASDSRPPDEVFQLSKFHPKWYIWHPQRERMEFRFDSDGTPGDLKFNDRGSHARTGPFGQVKIHDIEMAPDARQICPERTYLLDGLLTAPAADAPVREEAAAQILVPWGRILAGGNFDKADGVDVVFDPARVSSEPKTVVPNVVVSADVAQVEIAMFSLDTGERLDSLKFDVIEDAELWVSNGDPSDTAIDLDALSRDILKAEFGRNADKLLDEFHNHFNGLLRVRAESDDFKRFLGNIFTGGGAIVAPSVASNQFVRSSDVDIDFELFYTIVEGRDDGRGLSVPRRPGGKPFIGPNCLCELVRCREDLKLISNDDNRFAAADRATGRTV